MQIIYTNKEYIYSYNLAVASVAHEKKYLTVTKGFTLEESESFVSHIINNDFAQYLAIEDETVIGWCDIVPKAGEFFSHIGVLGIGILAEHRGKGIGKELLRKSIEKAVAGGLEKIELEVYASNVRAVSLYKNFGFKIEGTRKNGKKFQDEYEDVILMGKFL